MHTSEPARGRGVGRAMLEHLIREARKNGYRQLSLETGTMQAFAPARRLYGRAGFMPCEPFGESRRPESLLHDTIAGGSMIPAAELRLTTRNLTR